MLLFHSSLRGYGVIEELTKSVINLREMRKQIPCFNPTQKGAIAVAK